MNSKKTYAIMNVFFIIVLILCFIQINYTRDTTDLYEWDVLYLKYESLSQDTILQILGNPTHSQPIVIGEQIIEGRRRGLHRFQKSFTDTLLFKELYYKKGRYDTYLWLLLDRDSVWKVVDAVKYNPKKIDLQLNLNKNERKK